MARSIVAKVMTTKFVSTDGTEFSTREEAEAHEGESFLKTFANWKIDRVQAADESTTDKGKRDAKAIEKWADRLRKARKARGEVRPRRTAEERKAAADAKAKAKADKAAAKLAKAA